MKFENLRIWQDARKLTAEIYALAESSERFSRDFGFRSQLTRSIVSVMNNIAEGYERESVIEFSRFLDIARGSCGEARSMIHVAGDLRYIQMETAVDLIDRLSLLSRQIVAFKNKLKKEKKGLK